MHRRWNGFTRLRKVFFLLDIAVVYPLFNSYHDPVRKLLPLMSFSKQFGAEKLSFDISWLLTRTAPDFLALNKERKLFAESLPTFLRVQFGFGTDLAVVKPPISEVFRLCRTFWVTILESYNSCFVMTYQPAQIHHKLTKAFDGIQNLPQMMFIQYRTGPFVVTACRLTLLLRMDRSNRLFSILLGHDDIKTFRMQGSSLRRI